MFNLCKSKGYVASEIRSIYQNFHSNCRRLVTGLLGKWNAWFWLPGHKHKHVLLLTRISICMQAFQKNVTAWRLSSVLSWIVQCGHSTSLCTCILILQFHCVINSTATTRILHSPFQALHPDYIYLPNYSNNHMYAVLNNQYTTYKTLHRCLQSLRVPWRCTGVSQSMAEVPSSCLSLHSHKQKDILLWVFCRSDPSVS